MSQHTLLYKAYQDNNLLHTTTYNKCWNRSVHDLVNQPVFSKPIEDASRKYATTALVKPFFQYPALKNELDKSLNKEHDTAFLQCINNNNRPNPNTNNKLRTYSQFKT